MTQIVLYLLLGIAIGALRIIPAKLHRSVSAISSVCLFAMLTALGAKLGAQPEILDRIGLLGARAFALAFAAVFGAVAGVYLLQHLPQARKGFSRGRKPSTQGSSAQPSSMRQ